MGRRFSEVIVGAVDTPVRARVTVEKVHRRSGLIAERVEFDNLITDAGLGYLMRGGTTFNPNASFHGTQMFTYCGVGTGSAAPSVADVGLVSEVGRTNANGGFADTNGTASGFEYFWFRRTFQFTAAQANGNLTEVGFFYNASGAPMWARQLIRDANGNPTTIVKTADYDLRVVYEVRWYPKLTDTVLPVSVDGVQQNVTLRPHQLNSWNSNPSTPLIQYWCSSRRRYFTAYTGGMVPSNSGTPTGSLGGSDQSAVPVAYVEGSGRIEWDGITFASSAGNGLIRTLTCSNPQIANSPQYQMEFSSPFTKLNTEKMVVGFSITLSRYTP